MFTNWIVEEWFQMRVQFVSLLNDSRHCTPTKTWISNKLKRNLFNAHNLQIRQSIFFVLFLNFFCKYGQHEIHDIIILLSCSCSCIISFSHQYEVWTEKKENYIFLHPFLLCFRRLEQQICLYSKLISAMKNIMHFLLHCGIYAFIFRCILLFYWFCLKLHFSVFFQLKKWYRYNVHWKKSEKPFSIDTNIERTTNLFRCILLVYKWKTICLLFSQIFIRIFG